MNILIRHDTWALGLTINSEKGYNSAVSESRGIAFFIVPMIRE